MSKTLTTAQRNKLAKTLSKKVGLLDQQAWAFAYESRDEAAIRKKLLQYKTEVNKAITDIIKELPYVKPKPKADKR